MQRFATGPVIIVLALFAVWMAYGATRIAINREGRDAVFWTSIGILYAFAGAAAWLSYRLYRVRLRRRRGE